MANVNTEELKEAYRAVNRTKTSYLEEVHNGGISRELFIEHYRAILLNIIYKTKRIHAGRKETIHALSFPYLHDNLRCALSEMAKTACEDFLDKKLDDKFISAVHDAQAGKGKKISVRTTLQYMLWNEMSREAEAGNIVISGKSPFFQITASFENTYISRKTTTEGLRRYRNMLVNRIGHGDQKKFPNSCECYCLYCGLCDREEYMRGNGLTGNQELFADVKAMKGKHISDELVTKILQARYADHKDYKRINRKNVGNRRNTYADKLIDYILEMDSESSDLEAKELVLGRPAKWMPIAASAARIGSNGYSHDEVREQMKTIKLDKDNEKHK